MIESPLDSTFRTTPQVHQGTSTYILDAPYVKALALLRRALMSGGFWITAEIDVSETLRARLGVQLSRSRVLCVTCPTLLLEIAVLEPAATTVLPLHVAVEERRGRVTVHLVRADLLEPVFPNGLAAKFRAFAERLVRCLEGAGVQPVLAPKGL